MTLGNLLKKIVDKLDSMQSVTTSSISYKNFTPLHWQCEAHKYGRVCNVTLNMHPNATIATNTFVNIADLPASCKPKSTVLITSADQANHSVLWEIDTNGKVYFYATASTDVFSRMNFCFITAS